MALSVLEKPKQVRSHQLSLSEGRTSFVVVHERDKPRRFRFKETRDTKRCRKKEIVMVPAPPEPKVRRLSRGASRSIGNMARWVERKRLCVHGKGPSDETGWLQVDYTSGWLRAAGDVTTWQDYLM